jgi:hypothetical protein
MLHIRNVFHFVASGPYFKTPAASSAAAGIYHLDIDVCHP